MPPVSVYNICGGRLIHSMLVFFLFFCIIKAVPRAFRRLGFFASRARALNPPKMRLIPHMKVAFYTLGCKVNQNETGAMQQLFS